MTSTKDVDLLFQGSRVMAVSLKAFSAVIYFLFRMIMPTGELFKVRNLRHNIISGTCNQSVTDLESGLRTPPSLSVYVQLTKTAFFISISYSYML